MGPPSGKDAKDPLDFVPIAKSRNVDPAKQAPVGKPPTCRKCGVVTLDGIFCSKCADS